MTSDSSFICGTSRQGKFLLYRKSRRDRIRAKLKDIKEELRQGRHQPSPEQGKWLGQVVRGFFAYHAVPTNSTALNAFRHQVKDLWRRSLLRRSQKDRTTWARMIELTDAFVPESAYPSSMAQRTLRRQVPKVEAECLSRARSATCQRKTAMRSGQASSPREDALSRKNETRAAHPLRPASHTLWCSPPPRRFIEDALPADFRSTDVRVHLHLF